MGEGLMVLGSGWERGQFLGRDWPPWALTLKNKQLNSLSDHQVDFWQHILESDLMSNRRCCQFCTWWRYSFQGKWEKGWWCPTLAGREANFSGEELPPSTRTLGGRKKREGNFDHLSLTLLSSLHWVRSHWTLLWGGLIGRRRKGRSATSQTRDGLDPSQAWCQQPR